MSGGDARREAPAAARNRDPIARALRNVLPPRGTVLEVASGTGEHALHLAREFPRLAWQPSDADDAALLSIAAWRADGPPNLLPPLRLDAARDPFPRADAVLCVNMVHIAPWAACEGLVRGAAAALPAGAPLVLYGPFLRAGVETAPSNLAFDAALRTEDPRWGLRRLEDVAALAAPGFAAPEVTELPANNVLAVLRRR